MLFKLTCENLHCGVDARLAQSIHITTSYHRSKIIDSNKKKKEKKRHQKKKKKHAVCLYQSCGITNSYGHSGGTFSLYIHSYFKWFSGNVLR